MPQPDRQVNNPLKPKGTNSIFRNTDKDEPEQPATQQVESVPVAEPMPPVQPVTRPITYSTELPGQPQTHDRRHKVPFDQRYRKENIQVDRRMLSYFYDYIASGNSRVSVINKMLLKALIEAGYPLDPNLLDKPFKFEDLPK